MESVGDQLQTAIALHQAGDVVRAAAMYEAIIAESPDHAGAWHLLGVALHGRRELEAALTHIERALGLCDTKAVYWNNYGAVLIDLRRFGEARTAFERAVAIRRDYADAWSNLGLAQLDLGEIAEAERSLRYALELNPRHADALRHLARVYRERGNIDEAIRLCRDSIAVRPRHAETRDLLGDLLSATRQFEGAAEAYTQSLELQPNSAETRLKLGSAYADFDEREQAAQAFRAAADLRPDRPLLRLRELALCPAVFPTAEAVTEYHAELNRRLDEALQNAPPLDWRRATHDGFTPSFQLSHHGISCRAVKEKFARLFTPAFPHERPAWKPAAKIRVGFLCTAGHEGGFVRGFGRIMERLDRREFEVVGLVSASTAAFCRGVVKSGDIGWAAFPNDLPRAAKAIVQSRCDVIMHWQAGTDPLNYFLPFLPLAPVQCIGFGQHGTTGIGTIDYFISSRLFERGDDAAEDYTERLVQFAGATAWQPRPAVPAAARRSDFGLPESGGLYFCPQRLSKFHPNFDRLLSGVLQGDSEGHIVILRGSRPRAAEALQARFERTLGGRLCRRVVFLPTQKPDDYYRLMSLADAVLDSPAYSASLTGYDALGLGVPVVTLPGRHMVQRYALGLYRQMDMPELIAGDGEGYVRLAVRLARDEDFRAAMRRAIVARSEVLFEDDRVIKEYEEFFRGVVERSERECECSGQMETEKQPS